MGVAQEPDNGLVEQSSIVNDRSDDRLISNDQIEKTPTDQDHSQAKDGTDAEEDKDGAQDQKEVADEEAKAEPAAKEDLWLQDEETNAKLGQFLDETLEKRYKFLFSDIEPDQAKICI